MLGWQGRTRVREGVEKYLIPIRSFSPAQLPVRAVFILTQSDRSDIVVEPVSSTRAFTMLRKAVYPKRIRSGLKQQRAHFGIFVAMAKSVPVFRVMLKQQRAHFGIFAAMAKNVPVFRVTRPTHPFLLDMLADRIDAHLRGEPPCAGEDAVAAGQAASSAVVDG